MLLFCKKLIVRMILFFLLSSPIHSFPFTINDELRTATQLLSDGNMLSLQEAESVSYSATVGEPKASLAHWLRAQSLYGLAGVDYDFNSKDKPFIEEAKVRILPLPVNLLPGNIFVFPKAKSSFNYILLMETSTSRLYVYKIDIFGDLFYENSFYSSIGLSGDNKHKEGDKKTPIGAYRFLKEISNPRADGFLGKIAMTLDYPNAKDQQDGRTGYGIWLHGVPQNTFVRSPKASDGCLALSNKDIEILKKYIIYKKTHIVIVSKISWISPSEWKESNKLIHNLLSLNSMDSKNNDNFELLTYFRISKDRPSVVLNNRNDKFYREYWVESVEGLQKILSERLN